MGGRYAAESNRHGKRARALEYKKSGDYLLLIYFVGFEDLVRIYDKSRKVILQEGAIPRFYIRALAELDSYVSDVSSFFVSIFLYALFVVI